MRRLVLIVAILPIVALAGDTAFIPDSGAGEDSVGTTQINDGSDSPNAGECLIVDTDTEQIVYDTCSSGTGDVTAVGPACASGACYTDGVATTGTTWLIFEGTTNDTNELSLLVPSADPGADIDITLPSATGTLAVLGGNTFTGAHDFGGATLEIPNGTAPTADDPGELAHDTTADQLIVADTVFHPEETVCAVVEDLAAADDDFEFFMSGSPITITSVGCRCRGTCSTAATFTLEDRGGNAMTITGTNPTCATTGDSTFAAVTAGGALNAGEGVAFDVTNTPSPETDTYTLCVTYTHDRQ